eukprot:Colp12_sorted_trinity150504_noHs@3284
MKVFAILALCAVGLVAAAPIMGDEQRLIELSPEIPPVWMSRSAIDALKFVGVNFMDITDSQDLGAPSFDILSSPYNPTPSHETLVKSLLPGLKIENLNSTLHSLSDFFTRYYTSETGKQSSEWIYNKLVEYAGARSDITITKFPHKWGQNSLIARIEGTKKSSATVILGAHQDSIAGLAGRSRSPGVDDDGSGTVTVMEVFRNLAASTFKPEYSIEFHWYSAEEAGLLGSQAIATAYKADSRDVVAMLQIDMDMYVGTKDPRTVGIITDYTDAKLNEFIRKLIKLYSNVKYVDSKCGYGCSDHASWNKAGYPSAFPFETPFNDDNPHIHTSDDSFTYVDLSYGLEFAKFATGFVVEASYLA